MKFYKNRPRIKADFDEYDSSVLYDELVAVLGEPGADPQRWCLNTYGYMIHVHIKDKTLNAHGVPAAIRAHGTKAAADARRLAAKANDKHEKAIEKYQRKMAIQFAKQAGDIPLDFPEE
jgi:hypothetical protein